MGRDKIFSGILRIQMIDKFLTSSIEVLIIII